MELTHMNLTKINCPNSLDLSLLNSVPTFKQCNLQVSFSANDSFTPRGNLEQPNHLPTCFWDVGGKQSSGLNHVSCIQELCAPALPAPS